MTYRVVASRAAARVIEQTQDKLLGYPSAGAHVGGGIHVEMPDTWDGVGKPPPGWSSYSESSVAHPTLPQFAAIIDPDAGAALGNGRAVRLTGPERAALAADIAAGVDALPPGWGPIVVQPAEEVKP